MAASVVNLNLKVGPCWARAAGLGETERHMTRTRRDTVAVVRP